MNTDDLFMNGYKIPDPLSNQEVDELLEKIKQGDECAKEKLAKHNIRLVLFEVMRRFKTVEYDKKDLVSVGNIGLMKAIATFDISRKVKFSIYAVKCIDNEILTFLRKLKKERNVDSLDETIGYDKNGSELKIEDIVSDKTDIVEDYINDETYQAIRQLVNDLPNRDKEIIMLYFGFYGDKTYTQTEIANMLSLTQSHVSRLIKKNVKRLSQQLQKKGFIELKREEENSKQTPESTTMKEEKKKKKFVASITEATLEQIIEEPMPITENFEINEELEGELILEPEEELISGVREDKANNDITKDDCVKILKLLRTPTFFEMIDMLSVKEAIIISLKLGYVDEKYFSTEAIAQFLGIEEEEVIETTKKVLVLYKEKINNFLNDVIEIATDKINQDRDLSKKHINKK